MDGTVRFARLLALVVAGWLAAVPAPVCAEPGAAAAPAGPASAAPPSAIPPSATDAQAEFERIQADIRLSDERVAALRAEVERLERDRGRIADELVQAGERSRKLETSLGDAEGRMTQLEAEMSALAAKLYERRAVLAEVLAGLQRLGRKPPPAVVVRPGDALAAVRSALLMGAILPQLREEAMRLGRDLDTMARLRDRLGRERDSYRADLAALAEERTRLELLVEERRRSKGDQERVLDAERRRATELAARSSDLKDLIGRSERDLDAGRRAAQQAAAAPTGPAVPSAPPPGGGATAVPTPKQGDGAAPGGPAATTPPERRLAALDPARMQPSRPFADLRGRMAMPAIGVGLRGFGDDDGSGLTLKGIQLATRPRSTVTSPADGWVVYAGTFRTYGKLLIINGGGGYHVVLAGMERINVEIGQFVLAGEPVGEMGERKAVTAPIADIKAGQPVLYVEFRKDGSPIDPGPWWAKNSG
jgi:septal ring factor EnvC (AmiA/AmiB activator)